MEGSEEIFIQHLVHLDITWEGVKRMDGKRIGGIEGEGARGGEGR